MQRVIGSVLILTATGGAGYLYGKELKNYLEKLRYFRFVVSMIRGEIAYTRAPLPEVFSEVAARVKEPYRKWLLMLARETESREEYGFLRVWNRCAEKGLRDLDLKYEHRILAKEPGTFLGSLEPETLDRAMQLYLNKVDLEIEKLREGMAAKTRIGGCLGVMSGIFLIVILL